MMYCNALGFSMQQLVSLLLRSWWSNGILELNGLDEPDKDPGSGNGEEKGEEGPSPQGGLGHEEHSHQNAEPGGGDGSPCGGGDKHTCSSHCGLYELA